MFSARTSNWNLRHCYLKNFLKGMLSTSSEFSRPVDHLIKKMSRNSLDLRSILFLYGRQSSLRQTNLLFLLLLLHLNFLPVAVVLTLVQTKQI